MKHEQAFVIGVLVIALAYVVGFPAYIMAKPYIKDVDFVASITHIVKTVHDPETYTRHISWVRAQAAKRKESIRLFDEENQYREVKTRMTVSKCREKMRYLDSLRGRKFRARYSYSVRDGALYTFDWQTWRSWKTCNDYYMRKVKIDRVQ